MQNKKTLKELRKEIDATDDLIMEFLNRRAELVIAVGKLKSAEKGEFHVPSREREIYERLTGLNRGPFPNEALRSVFLHAWHDVAVGVHGQADLRVAENFHHAARMDALREQQ